MGLRLRNPNGAFPAGGYTFSDPHTAMQFPDEKIDLHNQALKVIEHRKANPHIYKPEDTIKFDPGEVQKEILIQVCSRVPAVCEDESTPGAPYPPQPQKAQLEINRQQGRVCPRCKSDEFTPIRCSSCGGNRISGWKCVGCGYQL